MNALAEKSWSPYVVGVGIGVLSWFTFAAANKPIGITTAFEHTAALAEKAVVPSLEQTNDYYAAKAKEGRSPRIGFEWMLVLGVFIGALLSSLLSGDRPRTTVPGPWARRFGPSVAKRLAFAFLGGGVMMFGARLAQGCTSGHGISGSLQLALSSWTFIIVAFLVGAATAFLLFGREGREHV
jgi:uncharacterized membrane protein YedE/YeeE